ncbi:ricin-type beta-trefoil lectin domain protein [Kitasatospora sp. NPDC001547]|uniref:ricin-type beta-trefoil lectin domain protein n=1 Tax=Kitasatospora sp. NPDC001547 TaxID=3364015 RepID=UPI0036796230
MRVTSTSPAKRLAVAAIAAALLGGTPGLAAAAAPQAAPPPQQTEPTWLRYEVQPPNSSTKGMDVDSGGKVVMAEREQNDDRQFWSLSGTAGKQLLKNKATGTCLTAPSNGAKGPVTLQTCDEKNVNQQWNRQYWDRGLMTVSLAAHPELYLTGSAQVGSAVTVESYHGTYVQHWSLVPPGY